MRKSIWAIEAKEWHGIGLRHIHHLASTSLDLGSTHPWFMHFEDILMYFEGDPLVIIITPLYYLPPHLIIVPWGHASEG